MEFLSANAKLKQKKPILFLHGAYCDSWVWKEYFLEYFSEQGYDCYTLDFKAEDTLFTMNPTTLNTYVSQVLNAINQIGEVPIIVAHSMGAAVMQKLYKSRKLDFPAWILMTPAPARNMHEASQEMLFKNPHLFSQMYLLQMLGSSFVDPSLAKHALFSDDFSEEQAKSYLPHIKNMPNSLIFDVMTLNISDDDLKVDFPVLVQAAKGDRLLSSNNIKTVETTFNTTAKYYESGHALMLDKSWKEVADDIHEFLTQNIK
jgi:pimeloyl-ACP methyl ester carboxylesterase